MVADCFQNIFVHFHLCRNWLTKKLRFFILSAFQRLKNMSEDLCCLPYEMVRNLGYNKLVLMMIVSISLFLPVEHRSWNAVLPRYDKNLQVLLYNCINAPPPHHTASHLTLQNNIHGQTSPSHFPPIWCYLSLPNG